jgi:hypothetical protein
MRKRHVIRPGAWDRLEFRITPSAVGLASPAEIVRIDAHVHGAKGHSQHRVQHQGHHPNHPAGGITVGSLPSGDISVTVLSSSGGSGIPASNGTSGGATSGEFAGGPHPVLSLGGIGVSIGGLVVVSN